MYTITPLPAFKDNYIWCLQSQNQCIVIDPGDAAPVLEHLQTHALTLTHILITHHHADHIGGLSTLKAHTQAHVYGPKHPAIDVSHEVSEGMRLVLPEWPLTLDVWHVPGHTPEHVAYLTGKQLFCGDTLFSGGCGRLLGGTAEDLFASLNRLKTLPEETDIYCTHEYTKSNLAFALSIEPENTMLRNYQKDIEDKTLTLPSTMGLEKLINPFLRCQTPAIAQWGLQQTPICETAFECFKALRKHKDYF